MTVAPGSAGALRVANQRRVLDALLGCSPDPLTQAELARITGLAGGTVSSIVRELHAAEIVDTVAGSGRRGTTVALSRSAGLVAGVDFGHSHVGVAVGDVGGHVLARGRERLAQDHAAADGLAAASRMLEALLGQMGAERSRLRTIGLGLPAPIHEGIVTSGTILPGWVGIHAVRAASAVFGAPVRIQNDANLGALAEHRRGAGRGYRNLVYVKVSSGVGAGLILDDRLFSGTDGIAGEFGHLTLDDQGPLCRCGSRGCMEAYAASSTALSMMSQQMPDATIDEVIAAAREGNLAAIRVFEDAGLHLGWGLAAVTNLLNPGIIVVGGDMARAGDLLLEPARQGLRRHALMSAASTPVVPGSLGDSASMIGALALAVDATDLVPEPA